MRAWTATGIVIVWFVCYPRSAWAATSIVSPLVCFLFVFLFVQGFIQRGGSPGIWDGTTLHSYHIIPQVHGEQRV